MARKLGKQWKVCKLLECEHLKGGDCALAECVHDQPEKALSEKRAEEVRHG